MEKPSSSIKFYGVGNDKWLGIVLSNSAQRTQIEGTGGFGLRVKVAIMGFHSSEEGELADDEITYALVQLGVTDGTGATNRQRSIRLTQGDVVTGEFLDGSARQQPVVTGCLGRTSGTRYGKGRFESKTGFEGKNKALGLLGRAETNETSSAPCVPRALPKGSGSDKSVKKPKPTDTDKKELLREAGIDPEAEATLSEVAKPPGNDLKQTAASFVLNNVDPEDLQSAMDDVNNAYESSIDAIATDIMIKKIRQQRININTEENKP